MWACTKPITLNIDVLTPSITIGGALAPRDAATYIDLLRAADQALYSARRAGPGQIVLGGTETRAESEPNKSLQLALSDALDRDELFLEWQSCQDIKTGEISGYEALVRWRHPVLGRLAPDRFVPLAEACGLSSRLDAWVVFHACVEAAACTSDHYFSVNISAQWIGNSNVVLLIRAALEQSGLSPGKLVLEITETTAINSEDNAIAHMRQIKEMGVRLALDDFGTGYSALMCLQTYPFDMVKLDRKFVSAIDTTTRSRLVTESVIQLAETLDIEVVAEGIETQAQADLLARLGCRLGQRNDNVQRNDNAQRSATIGSAQEKISGPSVTSSPRKELLLLDTLPPTDTKRWVPQRKAEVVAAVHSGLISVDYVCQRYNLTLEEFTGWQRAVDRGGLKARRIERTQFYRDLYENAAKQPETDSSQGNGPRKQLNRAGEQDSAAHIPQLSGSGLPHFGDDNNSLGAPNSSDGSGLGPTRPERRQESRLALLLRVAKLVIDGREQFCVIRDASTTGLKIKLFEPMPQHNDLAVELANGDQYAVQCVWSEGENAGLEFRKPIPLDHLLDYAKNTGRRRHLRLRIALEGVLHLGETTAAIVFHDVSQHGAAFKTEKWLLVNELVKIETAALPIIYARVRWRNHPHYGVSFEHIFQLQELAQHVSAAQALLSAKDDGISKVVG
jgi:EAL domain-containing protein (putative c-di-GMP-specific phosphodiesterase class I)